MSDLFETAIVEKRNVLNELRANNLTLQELRFFSIYLSKINPYDTSTREVRFKLSDFQRIMDFKMLNIVQLKAVTDSLLTKIVHIPLESGGYDSFQLFKRCRIDKDSNGDWYVYINAHDDALPLMFDFKDRYFKYELWNALRLKSANQIRMYEILKQYENIGKRELSVKDLRELLGISQKEYPRWDRFRDRVLDSCQQALKETTDICYTYERGKTGAGGKWLTIIFHISKNKDYVDQLTLFEFMVKGSEATSEPPIIESQAIENIQTVESEISQNERTAFFSECFDNTFSTLQVQLLMSSVNSNCIIRTNYGADIDKYSYLNRMYKRLRVEEQDKQIVNRFKYFLSMIENDKGGEV